MKNKRILVISDLHFPFAHKDWHGFLTKLKAKYKPDTIVNIGDEMDFHSINVSHTIDPDLPSPKDELELGKKEIQKLHKLFPQMTLLESNHGSMVLRRAMAKGMTKSFIKSYNQILEVGKGWEWKEKHFIDTDKGRILFGHQFSPDVSKAVAQFAVSVCQGHYHTISEVRFHGNDFHLNFGMTVGCLIDKEALSMKYMRLNLKKPILSCGLITNGMPSLTPMYLKRNGDWDNNIYI
jgi:hypothetical protein